MEEMGSGKVEVLLGGRGLGVGEDMEERVGWKKW